MKIDIEKYVNLPEGISPEELKPFFKEVLTFADSEKYSANEVCEVLFELANRQWHTYVPLDEEIKDKLENWLLKISTSDISLELAESIVAIVGHIGLPIVLKHLKDLIPEVKDQRVREELVNAAYELEKNVEDPYSGML